MSNEINSVQENSEEKRKIVIPGEVIVSGDDFLPGEGTRREGNDVVASKYGLAETVGKVVKIISLSGAFIPRKNNVVLGRIVDLTYNGWLVDIDYAGNSFLPIAESPRFINKN